MGRFVKWVRPPAQFKYGLIAALQIMLLMIRMENFSFLFYDAKRLNHDPPLIYGWIALIAGSVGMVVLGGGLMALSFYSARSGHDEAAWQDPDDDLS